MSTMQSLENSPPLTLAPVTTAPTESIDIVRAESELAAIDELMADLTIEFVDDSARS